MHYSIQIFVKRFFFAITFAFVVTTNAFASPAACPDSLFERFVSFSKMNGYKWNGTKASMQCDDQGIITASKSKDAMKVQVESNPPRMQFSSGQGTNLFCMKMTNNMWDKTENDCIETQASNEPPAKTYCAMSSAGTVGCGLSAAQCLKVISGLPGMVCR